jgi:hypothetical protein
MDSRLTYSKAEIGASGDSQSGRVRQLEMHVSIFFLLRFQIQFSSHIPAPGQGITASSELKRQ